MINIFYDDKNKRHFRGKKYFKNGKQKEHPHYILGETQDRFLSLGVTHKDKIVSKTGKVHKTHKLHSNPNRSDSKDSFMKTKIDYSEKKNYSKHIYENFKLSKEDESYVESRIKKFKK